MSENNFPTLSIRHAGLKATALLVLTIGLIVAFVLYVMSARGVFEETQRLVLMTDNSDGIKPGMDLTFSGFPIGRVRRAELADDGNVRILIDVARKDARWLRTSSVFTMERSLVGETKIRAFTGILTDPPLSDGAERTALRGDASEQIPQVMATMRDLLNNLERITSEDSPLNASLDNVRSVTERMKGRYGALGGVLGSDENAKKVLGTLDRANSFLEKTDARLNGRGGVMDDSQAAIKQLNELLRESRDSLKKVDAVLVEAQAIATNAKVATTDLGTLRTEVDASVRKATQLIDEINSKWPFARDTEVKLP